MSKVKLAVHWLCLVILLVLSPVIIAVQWLVEIFQRVERWAEGD